ncbi:sulfotransferase domain-containing protein [Flexithrix dorotheae]|uniref:sulfotransferase domain-containing protein n=1 Tax=Flexithrix dorotheae TaxID=70993 RepID=UPI0003786AD8|nr:sulfotransferase domain-containing protein [Flexithrix dorotheae]
MPEHLPNFIIIGSPRAGTTWIDNNIRCHPEIFMPKKKELHFFDRDFEKGLAYYHSYFDTVTNEKVIGEATPSYLHKPGIAQKIYDTLGKDIKIIVSLRHPVDRLYSRYWNAKSKFNENKNLTFEEKIKSKQEFISEGLYASHLKKYYELFPAENILVLLFDDLEEDPAKFLKKIYQFLKVDESYIAPLTNGKINAASSKPKLGKSILLNYSSRFFRKIHLYTLSQTLEKLNQKKLPKMDPKTRSWLIDEVYKESNNELEVLLGRNLDSWKK